MFKPGDRVIGVGVPGYTDRTHRAGKLGTVAANRFYPDREEWAKRSLAKGYSIIPVKFDDGTNTDVIDVSLRKIDDTPELTTWKEIARISGWVPKSLKRLEAIPAG